MRRPLLALGIVLLALGLGLWLGTDRASVTALIPSFFGAVFVLLDMAARRPAAARAALRGAWLLALVGAAGGLGRGIPLAMKGASAAAYGQIAMGVLCLAYVALAWPWRKAPPTAG